MLISGVSIFALFFISILSAMGLAILLVEKGDDWPMSLFSKRLRLLLSAVHPKLGDMLDCTVCASFWTALATDGSLYFLTNGSYFMWPFTGFAVAGLVWIVIQFLNAVDRNGDQQAD